MKKKSNILCLVLAIISSFSLLIELNKSTIIQLTGRSTISLSFFIVGVFLFVFYKKFNQNENYIGFRILSLIFALFMIFGYSYDKLDTSYFVFGNYIFVLISILKLIGFYFLFNNGMHFIYNCIKKMELKNISNKIVDKFKKHPLLFSTLFILFCWLPYIISFYPIVLSPDPTNQIKGFFNIPTRYVDGVELVDENVLITNDNPILHTVLLGGSLSIGHSIGNDNLGLFIYSIIQIIILLSSLIYSIKYMIRINAPNKLIFISILIYALVPIFPLYAMNAVKDVIFSSLVLLYVIKLFDIIRFKKTNTKEYILLTLLTIAICLTRNNGVYHIVLSLPFLLLIVKNARLKITLTLATTLVFYFIFLNVLLPLFKVTPGNKREMFSIPFQQTARYVKYYDDLNEEEIKIIDKVLEYDTLAERYSPVKSDAVKNKFNALSTEEDFKNYLKLWFKMFLRHPGVYVEATANNVYGYFYPNTTKWYVYYNEYNKRLNETGIFNYHYNDLEIPRKILSGYALAFPRIPIIGMFCNIGFVVWFYFFMLVILIKEKLKNYIITLAPALSFILVCVASPANTYFRYVLPFVFSLPVTVAMLYTIYKENKKNN